MRCALVSPSACAACRKPRRQVERVTGTQHDVDQRLLPGGGLDGGLVVRPRLVTQRVPEDRLADEPALLARDLQDEHVVHVVVAAEPLACGGVM